MMSLAFKAFLGATIVVLIGIISKTRNYYLAGLVPLFPTFALIAHYIVGSSRSVEALRATLLFGMWAVLPYLAYLISLWFFIGMMRLPWALLAATACWSLAAAVLIFLWARGFGH